MNKRDQHEGLPDPRNEYLPLAKWLQEVLAITPQQSKAELASITENGGQFGDDYHIEYYRQLPDFVMALLNNDTQATLRFAPLLFHLIGCPICHPAYLEIYDAMRATVSLVRRSVSTWRTLCACSWRSRISLKTEVLRSRLLFRHRKPADCRMCNCPAQSLYGWRSKKMTHNVPESLS